MRETKAALAARIAADNEAAARLSPGATHPDTIMGGTFVLVGRSSLVPPADDPCDWDLYEVKHPDGYLVVWTSALVRLFKEEG